MPRFAEETQKKVDARHANTAIALEESQALIKVPREARLAMPTKELFWEKDRFLERKPRDAILGGNYLPQFNSQLTRKIARKCEIFFRIAPNRWTQPVLKSSKEQSLELQCFNSSLTRDPMEWHWDKDRQISFIIWLEGSENPILEFPYLGEDKENPIQVNPISRKIMAFPSHPMYAFKFLEQKMEIHYLEIHGTIRNSQKPGK